MPSDTASTELTSLLPREAHGITRPRIVLLIGALYLGVMLAALDTTIVTTLMAHIASDLNALDSISWVATSYTVAYSAFQPIYGKLSDIWGRKKVSMTCTVMFGLGCLFCGMSNGMSILVFGRFLSGIGAGGMLSMSTITVSDYVPLRSRGIFQGLGNVAFGTGASLGGLLGGWLTAFAGWKFAFLAQVPMAAFCVLAQFFLVHEKPIDHSNGSSAWKRIDWVGSFSLVTALLLSMLGITTGGSHFPWASWQVLGSFVLSAVLLYVFYFWETYRAVEPVLPIKILTNRTVISACLTNFFGSGLVYAFLFYTPLLLQAAYHYSYTEIGHRVIVNFIGVASGSLGSGIIMRRTGKYHTLGISCGFMMCTASLLLLATPLVGPAFASSPWYQSLAYLCNGLGYSGMLTVTLLALMAAVEPKFQATATAAQYTFRGAGSSLGIAVAAAVFQNVLARQLIARIGTDTAFQRKVIERVSKSLEAIWDQPAELQPRIIEAYNAAGLAVQLLCLCTAVIALGCSVWMEEHDLERKPVHPRASTPPGPLESEPEP